MGAAARGVWWRCPVGATARGVVEADRLWHSPGWRNPSWRSASRDPGVATTGVFTTAPGPRKYTGPSVLHTAKHFLFKCKF